MFSKLIRRITTALLICAPLLPKSSPAQASLYVPPSAFSVSSLLAYTASAPVAATQTAVPTQMTISNPLEAEGVKLISFGSPEFKSTLAEMLDPELIAKADSFLPYSVVFVNLTGRYIWGFTGIYTYPDKIAPSGKVQRIQINPSVGGVGSRLHYLSPGAKYLLTPDSNFTARVDADGRRTLIPSWYDGIEEVMRVRVGIGDPLRRRVELSIDSVIYEDGILVGPDSADRLDEMNQRIQREKRFADSLSGLKGDALRSKLAEYSSAEGYNRDQRANRWLAKDLELRLNEPGMGEDNVRHFIEGMRNAQWFLGSQKVRRSK